MATLSETTALKVIRSRTTLPAEAPMARKYNLVVLNTPSADAAPATINSKVLFHNSKYLVLFMDKFYRGKIKGRTYNVNLTKEREDYYDTMRKHVPHLQRAISWASVNDRNVFLDYYADNSVFFDNSNHVRSYLVRAKEYFIAMQQRLSGEQFSAYKTKTVIVNVNDWLNSTTTLRELTKEHNPVYYLTFLLKRDPDFLKEQLAGLTWVMLTDGAFVKLTPETITDTTFTALVREMGKMKVNVSEVDALDNGDEAVGIDQLSEPEMLSRMMDTRYNFKGDSEVADVAAATGDSPEEVLTNREEEVVDKVLKAAQREKIGDPRPLSKRDEELKERQRKLNIRGQSVGDILDTVNNTATLETYSIKDKVSTTNANLHDVSYPSFEKVYNEKLLTADTMKVMESLNNARLPVFVRDIKVEDSSDELNLKSTYTFNLEDANRVRHTVTVDMPEFIEDKFMYLNGNKKLIVKQLFMKPIVKTGPNEVQICSNYNKIFMRRHGNKLSAKVEKLRKALGTNVQGVTVKYGKVASSNAEYRTFIEYDELAASISSIRIGTKAEIMFSQPAVHERLAKHKIKVPDTHLCVGFYAQNEPILINLDTHRTVDGRDLTDVIVTTGQFEDLLNEQTSGKKFMYTRATIMSKQVPISLLLSYLLGLSGLLRRANIQHHFSDTRPRVDLSQGVIQFADGYLVYDKYPLENSLLMNAFEDIETRAFDYEEFDSRDVYFTLFESMFGRRNIATAFDNFNDFMIDPITKEVLMDLNLPTTFVDVMLYANALLTDNAFKPENDMSLYRVRSNELINAYLYKAVTDAYQNYSVTAGNNNPVKISLPKDAVTKRLLMAQTVEDYSILNPIVELEKSRAITPKGHSGMNLDSAYTQDKRSYDATMLGILAVSTSPDANTGIVRQLTMEPSLKNARGYIDVKNNKLDELNDVNLFSPAELLSPLGVTRDDTIRTAMATKQSKHIVPIEKSSPVLISNGAEQTIPYHLSSDFTVVAKEDGKVIEIDEATNIAIVEYKSKQKQAIDLSPRIVKNGAGGFFLSNKLTLDVKLNQTFKANDILARDEKFFNNTKANGTRFNIGSLQKVAVMGGYASYEDSTFVTKKLSEDMAADIVMQRPVTLGKNANVDFIVNVGDKVKVGDELIRFETSFEDDSLNKFLASIGDELQEEIKSLGKTPIKTKYSGTVEAIKMYSTVELDELSPSLRKLVSKHYAGIIKKKKLLEKHDKSDSSYKLGILLNEPTDKVEAKNGKVKGNEVGDGVLIEFFIKYRDTLGTGDKIAFFTALKSIIGEVIPEDYEPYSLYRPEEEVSSIIAPGAVLARMTPSILQTMFGNKVLIELKHQLKDIYDAK